MDSFEQLAPTDIASSFSIRPENRIRRAYNVSDRLILRIVDAYNSVFSDWKHFVTERNPYQSDLAPFFQSTYGKEENLQDDLNFITSHVGSNLGRDQLRDAYQLLHMLFYKEKRLDGSSIASHPRALVQYYLDTFGPVVDPHWIIIRLGHDCIEDKKEVPLTQLLLVFGEKLTSRLTPLRDQRGALITKQSRGFNYKHEEIEDFEPVVAIEELLTVMFGQKVVDDIKDLSKIEPTNTITKEESRRLTKEKLTLTILKNLNIGLVKVDDTIHNISTADALVANENSAETRKRKFAEDSKMGEVFARLFNLHRAHALIANLRFKYLKPNWYAHFCKLYELGENATYIMSESRIAQIEEYFDERLHQAAHLNSNEYNFSLPLLSRLKLYLADSFGHLTVDVIPPNFWGVYHNMIIESPAQSKDYSIRPKITVGIPSKTATSSVSAIINSFCDLSRASIRERTYYGVSEHVMEGVYIPELDTLADIILYSIPDSSWRRIPAPRYFPADDFLSMWHIYRIKRHFSHNLTLVREDILDYMLSDEEHNGMTVFLRDLDTGTLSSVGLPEGAVVADFIEFVRKKDEPYNKYIVYKNVDNIYTPLGQLSPTFPFEDGMAVELLKGVSSARTDFPHIVLLSVKTYRARQRYKQQSRMLWDSEPRMHKDMVKTLEPYAREILLDCVTEPGEDGYRFLGMVDSYITTHLDDVIYDVALGLDPEDILKHVQNIKNNFYSH
jgi:hypothetical protein